MSFQCSECERTFKFKQTLNDHIQSIHRNEKHICEVCFCALKPARQIKKIHKANCMVSVFGCHHCCYESEKGKPSFFQSLSALEKHYVGRHKKSQAKLDFLKLAKISKQKMLSSVKCSGCNKPFGTKLIKKAHEKKCKVVLAFAKENSALASDQSLENAFKKPAKNLFGCSFCVEFFATKNALLAHKNTPQCNSNCDEELIVPNPIGLEQGAESSSKTPIALKVLKAPLKALKAQIPLKIQKVWKIWKVLKILKTKVQKSRKLLKVLKALKALKTAMLKGLKLRTHHH